MQKITLKIKSELLLSKSFVILFKFFKLYKYIKKILSLFFIFLDTYAK